MFTARIMAGAALAVLVLAFAVGAQQITAIEPPSATQGDVVRVFGSDLGSKPKLVLVRDGAAAKKTKLKVVGSSEAVDEVLSVGKLFP